MPRAIALTLLVAAAIAGCGTSATPTPSSQTFGEAWQARLPELLAKAPEEQRAILVDGVVEPAEYERAFLAYRTCIEDAGVVILALERDDNGLISMMSVADGSAAEGAEAVVTRCNAAHFVYVAEGWRVALNPDDSERQQLIRVASCLNLQGFSVPEEPADNAALLSALEDDGEAGHDAYLECVNLSQ